MNQPVLSCPTTLAANAALSRLWSYLDQHGSGLDAIVRQIRADPDASISTRLRALSSEDAPEQDVRDLERALRKLQDELIACIGEPVVETVGAHTGSDFDAGLRWHAARLADITSTLGFTHGI